MAQETQGIECPELALRACSVDEHCRALQRIRRLAFWWYLGREGVWGNHSIPFRDACDNWWYQVKPGLCWTADCFAPIEPGRARPSVLKSYLGFQHVVPDEVHSNSHLVINAIGDLSTYSDKSVDAKRRNSIRKGFRSCELTVVERFDGEVFDQCRAAWQELTERTGWKHAVEKVEFDETWRALLDCPGVTILIGRASDAGEVAGFLVTKMIGQTAYVDTIASRTQFLKYNVNDALMYAFLMNARRLGTIRNAHYAIRSYVETLEKFKLGLGFVATPFPTRTVLRGPTAFVLKRCYPGAYRRMLGLFDEPPPTEAQPAAAQAPAHAEVH